MECFQPGTFVIGANLPWVGYGIDFGANRWRPDGGIAQDDMRVLLKRKLAELATMGVSVVRWFLLCDGRAGIRFSADGSPESLDDYVVRDLDAALDAIHAQRMRVMFALFDFHWCKPRQWINGVQLGGRRRVLTRPELRHRLLDTVVHPILERYRTDERILAWDVINEPEWVTLGLGASNPLTGISRRVMREFIEEAARLIHDVTAHPVTVGSAGLRWRRFYQGLSLDFDQVHWYETLERTPPLETPLADLGFERPVLLGEFPTWGTARSVDDILTTAQAAGYAGAFHWPRAALPVESPGRVLAASRTDLEEDGTDPKRES
jgi:hypothetical protein